MACQKDKKQFELTINGKTFELLGLDDCVFGTLISFPENDEDIAEMMWYSYVYVMISPPMIRKHSCRRYWSFIKMSIHRSIQTVQVVTGVADPIVLYEK